MKTQANLTRPGVPAQRFAVPQVIRDYKVVIVLLTAVLIITAITAPEFFNLQNITNVSRQASVTGIVAIGMTYVVLTGGIDLSVSAILALAGVCFAMMLQGGVAVSVALAATALLGLVIGLVNGIGVTFLGIQAFIMTLATMAVAGGVALLLSGGTPISFDNDSSILDVLGNGSVGGVPGPVVVFGVGVVLATLVLRYLPFGRFVYGIGGSLEAARLSGVRTTRILLIVYMISGLCAALAGIVTTSRLFVGHPTAGGFVMLDSIAAVVIGGTSLMGGRGSMIGTVVGVLLLAMVANLLNLLGVSPFNQQIAKGLIIIVAVLFTTPGLTARVLQQWSAL